MLPPFIVPFQNYFEAMPSNTLPSAARSALYSSTISLLLLNGGMSQIKNFRQPLISGALAAIASLVHALMTPLFNYIFNTDEIKWYQDPIKLLAGVLLMERLSLEFLPGKVHFLASRFFSPRSLFLASSYFVKVAIDMTVPILNWSSQDRPNRVKNWFIEREVDFTNGSNAVFFII